jgi:hypothetical protein
MAMLWGAGLRSRVPLWDRLQSGASRRKPAVRPACGIPPQSGLSERPQGVESGRTVHALRVLV